MKFIVTTIGPLGERDLDFIEAPSKKKAKKKIGCFIGDTVIVKRCKEDRATKTP